MEHEPRILSVREHPEYARQAIEYISSRWREVPQALYDDCISESLYAVGPLPQWYLLLDSERIVGCAGLISNDFISRGDLWPWVCALYVEETFRERGYAGLLLERCRRDAERSGYRALYLSTELEGYYEKHGYDYIGEGYGPDGGAILIYRFDIRASALLASGGYVVRPERPGEEEELCRLVRTAFETAGRNRISPPGCATVKITFRNSPLWRPARRGPSHTSCSPGHGWNAPTASFSRGCSSHRSPYSPPTAASAWAQHCSKRACGVPASWDSGQHSYAAIPPTTTASASVPQPVTVSGPQATFRRNS